MDYKNFKNFQKLHKLNRWQARWYLKLQDYNFILQHIIWKMNTKADILSKKDQVNTKENIKNIKILKDELQMRRVIIEAEVVVF